MAINAGVGISLGPFKLFLTGSGGVRIGANIGDTYISHKVKKPNKRKKAVTLIGQTVST